MKSKKTVEKRIIENDCSYCGGDIEEQIISRGDMSGIKLKCLSCGRTATDLF